MKVRAAVLRDVAERWDIQEIHIDPPVPGEVLVKWAAAGLCHSDDHFRTGDRVPPAIRPDFYPLVGGHEGAGVVAEVGPGVSTLQPGDHVCASFLPTCGRCRYCATGRQYLCNEARTYLLKGQLVDGTCRHRSGDGVELNMPGKLGTFAEFSVVAEASLIKVADHLPLSAVALLSCGVTTGWGSAVERARTQIGDVVVVIGTGGLGIAAVQGAVTAGAAHVVAVDPIPNRREFARKFGATEVAATPEEALPRVMELTWGQGAERVILTPSLMTSTLLQSALDLTSKGGTCVVTGLPKHDMTEVTLDLGNLTLFNKEIKGSVYGSMNPRDAVPMLSALYERGSLNLDDMVTAYPLDDINEGFQNMLEGSIVRGVIQYG